MTSRCLNYIPKWAQIKRKAVTTRASYEKEPASSEEKPPFVGQTEERMKEQQRPIPL